MTDFEQQLLETLGRIADELQRANDRNEALDELNGIEVYEVEGDGERLS